MKKWIYAIALSTLSIALCTACGVGEESDIENQVVQVTPEEVRPQGEVSILNYEVKYQSGTFTLEDYRKLAILYEEEGFLRKQRDMLEQSFRLYGEAEDFEKLQGIYVNLAEEEEAVQAEAELMLQNLETPGYFAESIHQLGTEEWFATLMPKMREGVRNYYLEQDGAMKLVIRVGYEEDKSVSTVWYHGDDDKLTMLTRRGSVVQILETGLKNEAYNGEFMLWLLDGSSGSIVKETGNLAAGIYTGEYTVGIYQGEAAGDPYDLWNNRGGMEYTSYTDEADSEGVGQLEQFAIHLPAYPEFDTYEVKEDIEGSVLGDVENAPKMRVFDGELQWFDGTYWVSVGKMDQLEKEDPFYMYAKQDESVMQEEVTDSGLDLENISKPEPEETPEQETKPDNKPANTTKPTTTTKPNAQQATTPQATTKPTVTQPTQTTPPATNTTPENDSDDDDDDDDDDSGSDNSGSSSDDSSDDGSSEDSGDNGSSDSGDGGSDSGSDDSGDDDSNDADVEWSEDIM